MIHNSKLNLSVRERDIELDTLEIDHIFDWTIDGMNNVLSIVDKLQICTGIPISDLSYLNWDSFQLLTLQPQPALLL
jgi:hypothetical protein